jgi:hypothetical protein
MAVRRRKLFDVVPQEMDDFDVLNFPAECFVHLPSSGKARVRNNWHPTDRVVGAGSKG